MHQALECYNVTAEEEDENLRNINILEEKGCCEVEGPQIENLDIIVSLKTWQENIGTKEELKFAKIGDYLDDSIVDEVSELLCEYQGFLPTKFSNLKGIIGDFGMMEITFKLALGVR